MITITKAEFQQWILDQPDDRPVDMDDSQRVDDCGCVMVQYGRDKGFFFDTCGTGKWNVIEEKSLNTVARFQTRITLDDIIEYPWSLGKTTFGELKKLLQ